jgi:hypothetical protein
MNTETRKSGIGFHLDHDATSNKIILWYPRDVLSMEGAADVEMAQVRGHFHFN